MNSAFALGFSPLTGTASLVAAVIFITVLTMMSLIWTRRSTSGRLLCGILFILLSLNPVVIEETRETLPDVAVIAVDRSPSQSFGRRTQRTDEALSYLKTQIGSLPGIELRIIENTTTGEGPATETLLFEHIDEALADIPDTRRAGVVILSDGQIHDVPAPAAATDHGPVHLLLSGEKTEKDRQLIILEAPTYGIVGQKITIRYRIEDANASPNDTATLTVRQDSIEPLTDIVPANTDNFLTVTIDHAGQNIIDLETPAGDDELTAANNRVPLIVNGVRDRLRVLLVSGQPHAGGRTWRDMLTADPAVDLVHFTILREPEKLDATPQNELSLIAFPFEELFEVKLYEFDLIIFDRYSLNRILPTYYFGNIARYVREGGALLEVSGPSFATEDSVFNTDLNQILPGGPSGATFEGAFIPALTPKGRRHPVTQTLADRPMGPWLRQVGIMPDRGHILMTGHNGLPLLILDRAGDGRVAQIASDQIWLWARDYQGGGPYADFIRRLAHWLMKEPELEENALSVSIDGGYLKIERRTLQMEPLSVKITKPDGTEQTMTLTSAADDSQSLTAQIPAEQLGVYTVDDGMQRRFALAGDINPPELTGVRSTRDKLAPLVKKSGGNSLWLSDTPRPPVRLIAGGGRDYAPGATLGLRASNSFSVTGTKEMPVLPPWAWAFLLLGAITITWWREGKSRAPRA